MSRKANDSGVFFPFLNGEKRGWLVEATTPQRRYQWMNRKYKNIFQLYKLWYNRYLFFWVPTDHISVRLAPGGFATPLPAPPPWKVEAKWKKNERKSAVKKDPEKKRTFANTSYRRNKVKRYIYIFYRSFHFCMNLRTFFLYKHGKKTQPPPSQTTDSKEMLKKI